MWSGSSPSSLRSAAAALEYWLRAYRGTWKGSVFSGFVAPLLYLGCLGFGLGALIDRGSRNAMVGVPYAAFVATGLLAATAMQTGVGESTYPVLGAIIWNRSYLAMIATPLRVVDVLLGHLAFVAVRLLLVTTSFALVGVLLGAFGSLWLLPAVLIAVLCGLAHAAPVMAYAARAPDDQGFSLIYRLGVVPMFLFSGTFFPIQQLPALLRPVAWLTPLWHATEAIRGLLLGRASPLATVAHVGYLLLWALTGMLLARRTLTRRLIT